MDYQLLVNVLSIIYCSIFVFYFIKDYKYSKRAFERYQLINNQLTDIQNKLKCEEV